MQGAWVSSLVGELRSHMAHGVAKKKKSETRVPTRPWHTLHIPDLCPVQLPASCFPTINITNHITLLPMPPTASG